MWDKTEHVIPRTVFEERLDRVRRFVVEHDLAAVVVYSAPRIHQWSQTGHVGYLTNWSNLDRIVDTIVVVPRHGQAVLLLSGVEYMLDQIAEVSWIEDVRMVSSPDPRAISGAYDESVGGEDATGGVRTFGQEIRQILGSPSLDNKAIAISGLEAMSALMYQDLVSSMDSRIAPDVPDIVAELRSIKSAQEVRLLRDVASISDLAYQTMVDVLTDGMLGYELTAEMDHTARRHGADLVYHCMHSAPDGDLAAGKLSVKAHDCRLHRADYINVNAYVVHNGYWIQSDRAGTIGAALGGTAGRLVEANFRAQDEVLAAIRPGLAIGELIAIGDRAAERHGYHIQGGRIGHGQGLDYSERPFLIAGSGETLKPGHVFVLHVCLGIPGTNILINPIADLCHVTDDGVEVLNQFARDLFHK